MLRWILFYFRSKRLKPVFKVISFVQREIKPVKNGFAYSSMFDFSHFQQILFHHLLIFFFFFGFFPCFPEFFSLFLSSTFSQSSPPLSSLGIFDLSQDLTRELINMVTGDADFVTSAVKKRTYDVNRTRLDLLRQTKTFDFFLKVVWLISSLYCQWFIYISMYENFLPSWNDTVEFLTPSMSCWLLPKNSLVAFFYSVDM